MNKKPTAQSQNHRRLLPRMAAPMYQDLLKRNFSISIPLDQNRLSKFQNIEIGQIHALLDQKKKQLTNLFKAPEVLKTKAVSLQRPKVSHRALRGRTQIVQQSTLSRFVSAATRKSAIMKFSRSYAVLGATALLFGSMSLYRLNEDKISAAVKSNVSWYNRDLFTNGPVQHVWGQFWYRVFQKKQILDALLYLLITDIHEKNFVAKAGKFGQDWIAGCVQTPQVIGQALQLSKNTFCDDQNVVSSAKDLVCWFVQQPEALNMSAKIM